MSDDAPSGPLEGGERPGAMPASVSELRRSRLPGLVWAIPAAALLVVGYLALQGLAHGGVDVQATFDDAAGARAGDTQVIYRGLQVGRVTAVRLARDSRHAEMTLRLNPELKPLLRTGTRFWLIGANPSVTDLQSVKAALVGLSIGMAPGPGDPSRRFEGLSQAPVVMPDVKGRSFRLTGEQVGSIRRGSGVFYHGLGVGKVTDVTLGAGSGFTLAVFVAAPYDRLVKPGAAFWVSAPVSLNITGAGLSTQLAPPAAIVAGGVEFDTPPALRGQAASPAGAGFALYASQADAQTGPPGQEVLYDVAFDGPVGLMTAGAPVTLRGFRVGEVKSVDMSVDVRTGQVEAPVVIAVEPKRLRLRDQGAGGSGQDADGARTATDAAMAALVRAGFRARVTQVPALIGGRAVALEQVHGAGAASLVYGGAYPAIPTVPSGDVDALTARAGDILTKVDAMPLEEIGADVKGLTGRLNTLLGSPKVKDSVDHLDAALQRLDAMTAQVQPQVGPLIGQLRQTADQVQQTATSANGVFSRSAGAQDASLPEAIRQLNEASRSIRALADYLGRHPEALVRGKAKEK